MRRLVERHETDLADSASNQLSTPDLGPLTRDAGHTPPRSAASSMHRNIHFLVSNGNDEREPINYEIVENSEAERSLSSVHTIVTRENNGSDFSTSLRWSWSQFFQRYAQENERFRPIHQDRNGNNELQIKRQENRHRRLRYFYNWRHRHSERENRSLDVSSIGTGQTGFERQPGDVVSFLKANNIVQVIGKEGKLSWETWQKLALLIDRICPLENWDHYSSPANNPEIKRIVEMIIQNFHVAVLENDLDAFAKYLASYAIMVSEHEDKNEFEISHAHDLAEPFAHHSLTGVELLEKTEKETMKNQLQFQNEKLADKVKTLEKNLLDLNEVLNEQADLIKKNITLISWQKHKLQSLAVSRKKSYKMVATMTSQLKNILHSQASPSPAIENTARSCNSIMQRLKKPDKQKGKRLTGSEFDMFLTSVFEPTIKHLTNSKQRANHTRKTSKSFQNPPFSDVDSVTLGVQQLSMCEKDPLENCHTAVP